MILESIELKHVGPFRRGASIASLKNGINVLAAPNERGKSTFMRAAARALFDKHSCADDEIRALQPAGTDLSPTVTVVFEAAGVRYRIQKRFINKPASEISEWRGGEWQLLDIEDKADERLQKLLQSTVPGRGATKAAHWGLLGYLWARQGEASDWPSWDGQTGEQIQSRLARVEIDPVIQKLNESLWEDYSTLFTPSGKPRKNGELERFETELLKIEAEKEQIEQQRLELDSLERQFAELGPRLVSLQEETAKLENEANDLRAQASAAELLVKELQQRQSELDAAKEKLDAVAADIEQLSKLAQKLKESQAELSEADEKLNDAVVKATAAKQRVTVAQQDLDDTTARAKNLNDKKERIANLLKLNETERKRAETEKLAKKATARSEALRNLQIQLNKLPNITPAKLKKLQELTASIRDHETKLEATGLTVELKPESAANVTVLRDGDSEKLALKVGAAETIHAPQNLELLLIGWGRLRIRSGATELSGLITQLAKDRESLRDQLSSAECPSIADAETVITRRRDLQKEIVSAEETLGETLEDFESLEVLQSELDGFERQVKALRETLVPTADEANASISTLEADAERSNVAWRKELEAQAVATRELNKQHNRWEECGETRGQADRDRTKSSGAVTAVELQIAALQARYPAGMEKAKSDAQSAFVKAEARHGEAKKSLPPDADKLPERNKRAAAASEQLRQDLEGRKSEFNKLEGALQTRGAEGLFSKLSSLEEREAPVRQQAEQLRVRGWAARLAHDLIDIRKQAATRSVLAPLETRLSNAFAEVSQDAERRVFFDEHLKVRGIGPNENALIAYESLSQGAKEQLLLCLRLAVATEVAESGHKLVILDDVLVNTDSQRQTRVLDLLQTAANKLQILILTCHPERYRGVGTVTEIKQLEI